VKKEGFQDLAGQKCSNWLGNGLFRTDICQRLPVVFGFILTLRKPCSAAKRILIFQTKMVIIAPLCWAV